MLRDRPLRRRFSARIETWVAVRPASSRQEKAPLNTAWHREPTTAYLNQMSEVVDERNSAVNAFRLNDSVIYDNARAVSSKRYRQLVKISSIVYLYRFAAVIEWIHQVLLF